MTPIGLSLGHDTVKEAEGWLHHLLHQLGLPAGHLVACTHLVHTPRPHVAVSLAAPLGPAELPPTPPELAAAAEHARRAHSSRTSGRAVCYPGVSALTGTLTVADLLAVSAIDRITVLGGPPATPATPIDTRDFVRPQWIDGILTLVATPAPAGRIAPFEIPNPTPCCADHT